MVITIRITHQLVRQLELLHRHVRPHLHRRVNQKDLRPRPSHQHHPRRVNQKDLRPRPSHQHRTIHLHPDQIQWEHPVPVAEEVPDLVVVEAEDDN